MISLPEDRILILDGAMGTMIQRHSLTEADYHCGPFAGCAKELKGNNECLNLTRPEIIRSIHREYIEAGADIIESNTFSANRISQAEYGCEGFAAQMAYEGARIAREAADEAMRKDGAQGELRDGSVRRVLVAGSMGPTSKSLSLASDLSDPSFRLYSFDEMKEAYREQAEALLRGGADLLLIETCFDALNVKAALSAIFEINPDRLMTPLAPSQQSWAPPPSRGWQNASSVIQPIRIPPVMISVSVSDRSGRTLTGQTMEAFYAAVKHYPILTFGLNCSLGASELTPLVEEIGRWCGCGVSCYPNAGLPNEMGGYDQSPEDMAAAVKVMAEKGLLNIAGGCCGTTPAHIKAIAEAVHDIKPRRPSGKTHDFPEQAAKNETPSGKTPDFTEHVLTVSGLEAVTIDVKRNNFTNIGERTNVAGSRKFAKLIAAGDYDTALRIAAKQIEDGASVIDINMDDAMLDSTREMQKFVRHISNDPSVAKAALMIDSSHWETILAGLKNAQGKCIVNSISLKEGEEIFVDKARTIKSSGAAMVVMAFDEKGQATTYSRKIEICERAYRLLTEKAGVAPEDIIFDVNILSIGTGIEEHAKYAVDFIEAVRWIKTNLPGALTSGGVSNLSFAFRGNNAVREAMHSAFLYHAIKAGLDMAIVNPSMLQVYDEIEPELLRCVEDVIFDRDPQATERLIDKASRMLAAKEGASSAVVSEGNKTHSKASLEDRLKTALVKGRTETLEEDLKEAMNGYGSAVAIIEGPLMAGMETVGKMFGEGRMFLPQVVKSAKVMRDAVAFLEPYMDRHSETDTSSDRNRIVIATVKGDVHDIGKNITGIVLTCNGFEVHDLGVMVDRETILSEAERLHADIIAVSGLITPSLYQMEEICREMAARGMDTPLFIGGATTSALHTAVKLAPLYDHVYYGTDASASAVMAKKCMMDREAFEQEQHAQQQKLRELYHRNDNLSEGKEDADGSSDARSSSDTGNDSPSADVSSFLSDCPPDIPATEIPVSDVLPYFDWKMFYAIWGVKYGSQVPEAAELMQLRRDAEEELEARNARIMVTARFFNGYADGDDIIAVSGGSGDNHMAARFPMLRQNNWNNRSLSDFVIPESSGRTSPFGIFAVCVKPADAHEEGCCCPACSNRYEDMVGRTVRQTLAEAASNWLDDKILSEISSAGRDGTSESGIKIIKPAAGYASCPDHTLKRDILGLLSGNETGISLTESCAMRPDASICGFIFMHPDASYPDIRRISRKEYEDYAQRRGMDEETARRFLSHLLK
ncbi:MAG: methionine synthase [Bacteroidales bacterium]|nr:methionine synthase [Bacteroidales bacterium]